MSHSTYRLIMPLPPQYARGRLYFTLLPLFESGLDVARIGRALDPIFERGTVPVRAGRRTKIGRRHDVPVTEIASNCTELVKLHFAAWESMARELKATIVHPSQCREGFRPFVRDRKEGFCPEGAEFVCDTVVLDMLNFGRDGRDPVKTWRLR